MDQFCIYVIPRYPYKRISGLEFAMWIFNAGFVLYEAIAIATNVGYFEFVNNVAGFIIGLLWIVLALIRFLVYFLYLDDLYCNIDECADSPVYDTCPPVADDPCYRNTFTTSLVTCKVVFLSFIDLNDRYPFICPPLRIVYGAVVNPIGITLVSYRSSVATQQTCGTIGENDIEHGP